MDPLMLAVMVFGLTVLGGIALYETVFSSKNNVSERLSVEPDIIPGAKFGAAPAQHLLRWTIRRMRETQSRSSGEPELPDTLTYAGYRGIESKARLQLTRFAIMGVASILGILLCLSIREPSFFGAVAGFALGYIIPKIVIGRVARSRQRRMTRELPDLLALMVVSLEAGIGITEALRLVGRETVRQGHVLGHELELTSAQMAAGVSFEQALKNLGTRTGVDEIKSLAGLLIQSEKIGARLAPALRASANLINSRRRMAAEEAARKASVKMLFPLVFFILPAMLLIILGPAVIQMMAVFGNR